MMMQYIVIFFRMGYRYNYRNGIDFKFLQYLKGLHKVGSITMSIHALLYVIIVGKMLNLGSHYCVTTPNLVRLSLLLNL